MKKKLKFAAFTLLVTGVASFCAQKEKANCNLSFVTYSLCTPSDNEENAAPLQEYIKYSAADGQTLRFEQGLIVNCCCDSIRVESLSDDHNIVVVDVYDYGVGCNCVCLGYVNYSITGLHENGAYSFTFKRNGRVCYSKSIVISVNINETILLNNENEI
jgi:hypothetical protein